MFRLYVVIYYDDAGIRCSTDSTAVISTTPAVYTVRSTPGSTRATSPACCLANTCWASNATCISLLRLLLHCGEREAITPLPAYSACIARAQRRQLFDAGGVHLLRQRSGDLRMGVATYREQRKRDICQRRRLRQPSRDAARQRKIDATCPSPWRSV